jgi:Ca2+-binding EF-hand superfamily protein
MLSLLKDKDKLKKTTPAAVPRIQGLTAEEAKKAQQLFTNFDRDGNRTIDEWELRLCLEATGQNPTNEHIKELMQILDDNKSGTLDFQEFAKAIQLQKKNEESPSKEDELASAFKALGGNPHPSEGDKATIKADVLINVNDMFGLKINVDSLMDEMDKNNDGSINFEEFQQLFR